MSYLKSSFDGTWRDVIPFIFLVIILAIILTVGD